MKLKGKTALIAGASRNIGRTIALTFAREGAEVIAVARQHEDELKQVAQEREALGTRASPLCADLGDHEAVNRMAQRGLDHFGKVDIVVIVDRLNAAIVAMLQTPAVKDRFLASGVETVGSTPERFAEVIRNDVARMSKVIKDAGIRVD